MSSVVSAVGGALGFKGPGRTKLPKKQPELGRLSLTELGERRKLLEKRLGKLGGFGREGGKFGIGRRAAAERKRLTGGLTGIATARQSLIRKGTAARTGRATTISTLLGRGR